MKITTLEIIFNSFTLKNAHSHVYFFSNLFFKRAQLKLGEIQNDYLTQKLVFIAGV